MKIPNPPKNELLNSERKELFRKITLYIADKLSAMMDKATMPVWTASEIQREYGIKVSNITEFRNYEKYKRNISQNELSKLIIGGLVTVNELEHACVDSEKERKFLDQTFKILEHRDFLNLASEAVKQGYDPLELMAEIMKQKGIIRE